jgi:hypothetical protein
MTLSMGIAAEADGEQKGCCVMMFPVDIAAMQSESMR